MTNPAIHFENARQHVRDAVRDVSPFLEHFTRFGFAAKGVVYLMIGILAAMAPVGMSDRPVGTRGALQKLFEQPVGWLLLAFIALGLLCFGLWQLMRAVEDPELEGTSWKAIFKRVGWAGNALIHFGFVLWAVSLIFGFRHAGRGEDQKVHDWTAWAMSYPFGRWVIAGVGAGIVCYGIFALIAGIRGKLDKRLVLSEVGPDAKRWIRGVSRFGVSARGVVFAFIGMFLVRAAYHFTANEAHGLAGALGELLRQPYGKYLLATVAIGLIAYGLYDFVLARWRHIRI
jgi:hypothetical protein